MAATTTRRPAPASRTGPSWLRALRDDGGSPAPALLGLALAVAVLYAAFANGSIGIPEESRLQVAVALISLAALGALLYGSGLRVRASPGAGWGVALLVAFAGWAALSITWSIAPDESWLEANRALAYALVVALGMVLGSSLPRAAERVGLALLAIATVIALYALGGKLFPWLHVGGVIDLNHTERFSRLRAPLDYWNALGLVCVVAVPLAMRVVVELRYRTAVAGGGGHGDGAAADHAGADLLARGTDRPGRGRRADHRAGARAPAPWRGAGRGHRGLRSRPCSPCSSATA